jgi:hypothetical protein
MVDMEATQMKRKIALSQIESTTIIAALMAYECPNLADSIHVRFEAADPTNDGPEVGILSVELLTI